jgi:hypothetical protein
MIAAGTGGRDGIAQKCAEEVLREQRIAGPAREHGADPRHVDDRRREAAGAVVDL